VLQWLRGVQADKSHDGPAADADKGVTQLEPNSADNGTFLGFAQMFINFVSS
jgi:hypothetical protein